ncbi:tyrosinase family oxidase copper chaperone [Streptomyces olindensis]|uniref:tyrosinase family oxidase copper chaperone n=1 Tax=Streptomyces olindensis TaxID=358823 RepID=UPI00340DA708
MVVGVGGVPVGAERGPVRPAADAGVKRRDLARGLLGAVSAVALAPVVAASRPGESGAGGTEVRAGDGVFDEVYRGRRIRGVLAPVPERATGDVEWHVTVDGRPLHLMRRADGSWLSMVDHYRSYPSPLAATRAAVDELGPGSRLREVGGHGPGHLEGGPHGVHA